MKQTPHPEVYALRVECLQEAERLSEQGALDLFYGDESGVCLQPCVPYAWQGKDERVFLPSEKGGALNCFALLSRDNRCLAKTTTATVTAQVVSGWLDAFSFQIPRLTVVVLDNAKLHRKAVRERCTVWQERGLFVLFLPPYSPHLNIAEVLWRKLKYEWLRPDDYADDDTLHYAVWQALATVGDRLAIRFSTFKNPLETV